MLEHHREHHATKVHAAALRDWQTRHDAYEALVDTARTFAGTTTSGLLLDPGETVFLEVDTCQLVEARRGRGTFVGHSQGISVPVARVGGRQIRYRVGASKGHYVQGDLAPTAIDTGTLYVTSTRVVFRGANQTRECRYAKLLAVDTDDDAGTTTLSVSNRSKPTTIHYGPAAAATVDFRLDLALAHYRGTVDELVAGLEADLAAIDASRPADGPAAVDGAAAGPPVPPAPPAHEDLPPSPGGSVGPPPDAAPAAVAAGWFPDPWAAAPLRWWTGSAWSWQTVDPAAPAGPTA